MSLDDQISQTVDPLLFTRLCNSLFTAEHGHAFQVIDGTRGDEGNDGWLETERRIVAIYCPLKPERRKDSDYREKAFQDLEKAARLRDSGRYPVVRWSFITPRKLANEVIVDIRKRGAALGLEVNHIEATYLSGLLLKHSYLIKDFPDYYVFQLEEMLKKVLESEEVKRPRQSSAPHQDILSYFAVKKAAAKDAALKEIIALCESKDVAAAKLKLRALFYTATNPLVQVNAVIGLINMFSPVDDDTVDLANMCESARNAARRINSKAAEAFLLAQRGLYQSFEFGRLSLERWGNVMAEQAVGLSLQDPGIVAERQERLQGLSNAYTEAFKGAFELAKESQSGAAMGAVLISIGNASGHRALALRVTGPRIAFDHERNACKTALLAAKDIYAQLGDEHEIAVAQMNLANQIRFFGEVEEAKELVKSVIFISEKFADEDLLRKGKLLEERLLTGEIPDYLGGAKPG